MCWDVTWLFPRPFEGNKAPLSTAIIPKWRTLWWDGGPLAKLGGQESTERPRSHWLLSFLRFCCWITPMAMEFSTGHPSDIYTTALPTTWCVWKCSSVPARHWLRVCILTQTSNSSVILYSNFMAGLKMFHQVCQYYIRNPTAHQCVHCAEESLLLWIFLWYCHPFFFSSHI